MWKQYGILLLCSRNARHTKDKVGIIHLVRKQNVPKNKLFWHVRVCIRGSDMLVFRKILRPYKMDDPLLQE